MLHKLTQPDPEHQRPPSAQAYNFEGHSSFWCLRFSYSCELAAILVLAMWTGNDFTNYVHALLGRWNNQHSFNDNYVLQSEKLEKKKKKTTEHQGQTAVIKPNQPQTT